MIAKVSKEPIKLHVLIDRQVVRRTADAKLRNQAAKWEHVKCVDDGNLPQDFPSGTTVQRLHCDICNLDLCAAFSGILEKACDVSVVSVGKHLCGAAAGMSL